MHKITTIELRNNSLARRPGDLVHLRFDGDQKIGERRHVHQPKAEPQARSPASSHGQPVRRDTPTGCRTYSLSRQAPMHDRRSPRRRTSPAGRSGPGFACKARAETVSRRIRLPARLLFFRHDTLSVRSWRPTRCRARSSIRMYASARSHRLTITSPRAIRSDRRSTASARLTSTIEWQGRRESNSQPLVLETGALPIELHPYGECRMHECRMTNAYELRSLRAFAIRSSSSYSRIFVTTPEPTVLPPSRMAKRTPSSMAIGLISSTLNRALSPGMHISAPPSRLAVPVTSVVRK